MCDVFASCSPPAITDLQSPNTPALDATFATQAQRMLSRHDTPRLGPGHAIYCWPARCDTMIYMLWRGPHVVALRGNTSHPVACSVRKSSCAPCLNRDANSVVHRHRFARINITPPAHATIAVLFAAAFCHLRTQRCLHGAPNFILAWSASGSSRIWILSCTVWLPSGHAGRNLANVRRNAAARASAGLVIPLTNSKGYYYCSIALNS